MIARLTTFSATAIFAVTLGFGGQQAEAATFTLEGTYSPPNTAAGGNACGPNNKNATGTLGPLESGTDDVCNVSGSPWIVKYDYDEDDDTWAISAWNDVFGSQDDFGGIDISFDALEEIWKWSYSNDGNDPGITAFAAKGSTAYNLYQIGEDADPFFGGSVISFAFPQGNSNITFFDTSGPAVVPLPAAGWLLLGGLGGLAALRRRRKAS